MADLVITASQVQPGTGHIDNLLAGEALTAGQVAYKKTSDGKAYKAQADGTEEEAGALGIVVNDAALGQRVAVQKDASVTLGAAAAPAVGTVYVVSQAAGGIAPLADLVTTDDFISILGVGDATNTLKLGINNSAVQLL